MTHPHANIYAYYRVSTTAQDYESQRLGVLDYCNRNNLRIDKEFIDDGVSGTVAAKDRHLGELLNLIQPGDIIITSELSRLGRSTVDVINTCNLIAEKHANCYMVKQSMQIDQTPVGKLMIAIFSAFAEMEADLIRARTKEGLARIRASGKHIGRTKGVPNRHHKLDGQTTFIQQALRNGISKVALARKLDVSIPTLNKHIAEYIR